MISRALAPIFLSWITISIISLHIENEFCEKIIYTLNQFGHTAPNQLNKNKILPGLTESERNNALSQENIKEYTGMDERKNDHDQASLEKMKNWDDIRIGPDYICCYRVVLD